MINICACVPIRMIVWVMVFTACFISYMLRVNMSINIIAMVTSSGKPAKNISTECYTLLITEPANITLPDHGPRYDWDSHAQGLVLGSYFWGYIITSMPGGVLAERFGPRRTIGYTTILSAVLTLLTPLAAHVHYGIVIVVRFVLGVAGGVAFPALHCLVSRWAPPQEKGKFMGSLLGGTLGTVITWPMLGGIIELWGWKWSFYIPGAISLFWCLLWMLLIFDFPDVNPCITEEEKDYIMESLGGNITKTKKIPPFAKIFTSLPFWALTVCHFGNLWGLYLLITGGPKFMSEALGFDLSKSGALAALPHLMRMLCGFFFGWVGDVIRTREWMSVTAIRKTFVIFSHIIPGVLLFALLLVGCNPGASVALISLSLGSNGASTITNLQNNQDLAPNFAGTIYGIINCIGGTTGFITPLITGFVTATNSGLYEWRIIFSIGATVYIACGITFMLFGTGKKQSWNDVDE